MKKPRGKRLHILLTVAAGALVVATAESQRVVITRSSTGGGGGDALTLTYQGSFLVPDSWSAVEPNGFSFAGGIYSGSAAGAGLAYDSATNTFFMASVSSKVAAISNPTPIVGALTGLNRATLVQTWVDPFMGNLPAGEHLSGLLVNGNDLIVAEVTYYDGGNIMREGHWRHSKTLSSGGTGAPYLVGDSLKQRFINGYMTDYGSMALTGMCCLSTISTSSLGPSVWLFDPTATTDTAGTPWIYYPLSNPTLGNGEQTSDYFTVATGMAGVAVIDDKLVFLGNNGTGQYCYGEQTLDPELHGTPVPPENVEVYCYDPERSGKGGHLYPYQMQFWIYNLAEASAPPSSPWELATPTIQPLTFPYPSLRQTGSAGMVYVASSRTLYIAQYGGEHSGAAFPVMHVYHVEE